MSLTIDSNLNALSARNQAARTANHLATAIERLSSGLRINSARDDAAGLAISERFTAQIRGTDQAARNTNDAVSLAQTAEGALASISNNLQRIRELAVQAANGSNSASDRAALQAEATQLVDEVDRIASQTEFNGSKLLDGSWTGQAIQLGANRQQNLNLRAISDVGADSLGIYNGISSGYPGVITVGVASTLSITLNGPGTVYNLGSIATDGRTITDAINAAAIPGLSATLGSGSYSTSQNSIGAVDGVAVLTINGVSMDVAYVAGSSTQAKQARVNAVMDAINAHSAATGVRAYVSGTLQLSADDGRNIMTSYSAGTATGSNITDYGVSPVPATNSPSIWYQAPLGVAITSVSIAGAGLAGATLAVSTQGSDLRHLDMSTTSAATSAIKTVDVALTTVNAERANLGALQNRLVSAMGQLQTSSQNMGDSRGRIQDADFAQETADLSRSQILQQAGNAMVVQANQSPQAVLTLLR